MTDAAVRGGWEGKEKLGDGRVRYSYEGKEGGKPCAHDGAGGEVANMLAGGMAEAVYKERLIKGGGGGAASLACSGVMGCTYIYICAMMRTSRTL
jgi:hypothetical protein